MVPECRVDMSSPNTAPQLSIQILDRVVLCLSTVLHHERVVDVFRLNERFFRGEDWVAKIEVRFSGHSICLMN